MLTLSPTARRFVSRLATWPVLCAVILGLLCTRVSAGGGPRNVLVVVNSNSQISQDIADYYVRARGIPASNIVYLSCSVDEVVSKAECESNILAPVRSFLASSSIGDRIDFIVLTKGVPLAADYGFTTGVASVASVMTCITEPDIVSAATNPYGPTSGSAVEGAFSHSISYGGRHIYLVTRLDGYTFDDVKRIIDSSRAVYIPGQTVLLDSNGSGVPPYRTMNSRLASAGNLMKMRGLNTVYDGTTAFLGGYSNLIGYFSWGSNDGAYTHDLYASNRFAPGSVADTYVSTSGRTFSDPLAPGQSLIADLIRQGASAVNGYVSEPYTMLCTYPDILFDRYTKGYNVAESFYAASPEVYWKAVLVADPLMAPFASSPNVTIVGSPEPVVLSAKLSASPADTIVLTGQSVLSADATSTKGISKVEFFLDDNPVGTATSAPYSIVIDTTAYTVGAHHVEAIAYDASPAATQGSSTVLIYIENDVSNLTKISDSFRCKDGQGVFANSMIAISSSSDTPGQFYIEDVDRSSGIRVVSTTDVKDGDLLTVSGSLATQSGERCIVADAVTVTGCAASRIRPLAMPPRMVGGADFSPETRGVTGGKGLRNIGLLVRTFGIATAVGAAGEDWFLVNDGNISADSTGSSGLKVICKGVQKPAAGDTVAVTGVSSVEQINDIVHPVLRTRNADDLTRLSR